MTALSFTKTGSWYESDAVEVGGDFAVQVDASSTNEIEILKSVTGTKYMKAYHADAGETFVLTYTGAVNGMLIKVRSKQQATGAITW